MHRSLQRICFLVLLLTLVSLAPAVTLYLLSGLLLVNWWSQKTVAKRIRVEREVTSGKGFVGDELTVTIRVANPTCFPVAWGTLYHSFSQLSTDRSHLLFSLASGGQKMFSIGLVGQRRGIYDLPPSRLRLGDPWGLTEKEITATGEERIIVFPSVLPLQGLTLSPRMPWGPHRFPYSTDEDPTRLQGCREYVPGDSFRKIHWPNLARTGRLHVKEWETTRKTDYGIFLDLQAENLRDATGSFLTEFLIELAASLLYFLTAKDESISFYCNGKAFGAQEGLFRLPAKQGKRQAEKILTYLAGVSPGSGQEWETFVLEAKRLPTKAVLLFLTPVLTRPMVEKAARLRKNGFQPIFLWPYFRDRVVPTAELKHFNLPWYIVRKGRDPHGFILTPGK
jgi:uncharacterized protein (DUF58 family)